MALGRCRGADSGGFVDSATLGAASDFADTTFRLIGRQAANLPDAFARARQKFDGHSLLDANQDAAARRISGDVLRRAPPGPAQGTKT